MPKILVSYGYGAGWSTWNSGEVARYMLTYQPIIDFLEAGNRFSRGDVETEAHPLLVQLENDCQDKFGVSYVCVLGAYGLEVVTINDDQVHLTEYDGNESYITRNSADDEWITL